METPVKRKKYKAQRKKIYKGRMAPTGSLFLELTVYDGRKKYKAVKHIPGGLGQEAETNIVTQMYLQLQNKYFTK